MIGISLNTQFIFGIRLKVHIKKNALLNLIQFAFSFIYRPITDFLPKCKFTVNRSNLEICPVLWFPDQLT